MDNVPPTRQANQCIRHWVHVFGFTNHSMLTPNARPNHTPNTLPAASRLLVLFAMLPMQPNVPPVQQIDFSLGHCIGDVFDRQLYKLDRAHHELNTQTCVSTYGRWDDQGRRQRSSNVHEILAVEKHWCERRGSSRGCRDWVLICCVFDWMQKDCLEKRGTQLMDVVE